MFCSPTSGPTPPKFECSNFASIKFSTSVSPRQPVEVVVETGTPVVVVVVVVVVVLVDVVLNLVVVVTVVPPVVDLNVVVVPAPLQLRRRWEDRSSLVGV